MRIEFDLIEKCCGCEVCASACPVSCIEMTVGRDGFYYPKVNTVACIECGNCSKVCPVLNKGEKNTPIAVVEGFSKNSEIRRKSSSGGVFSELAKVVLSERGIVYGSAFDETLSVKEIGVENADGLERLRGSKYVQSRMGMVYCAIEQKLKTGRKVLCSGTPCQIRALNNYLRREYDNLLTVDFVCHGVPPQLMLDKYCAYVEQKIGKSIQNLFFRDKSVSWEDFGMRIVFEDGSELTRHQREDDYLRLFLQNICLRGSCHNCPAKEFSSGSDLTLGDCWRLVGTEKNDHLGTSVIFLNTQKGKAFWENNGICVQAESVDYQTAISSSRCITHSTVPHKKRAELLAEYYYLTFEDITKKYLPGKIELLVGKILRKTRKMLRRQAQIQDTKCTVQYEINEEEK